MFKVFFTHSEEFEEFLSWPLQNHFSLKNYFLGKLSNNNRKCKKFSNLRLVSGLSFGPNLGLSAKQPGLLYKKLLLLL